MTSTGRICAYSRPGPNRPALGIALFSATLLLLVLSTSSPAQPITIRTPATTQQANGAAAAKQSSDSFSAPRVILALGAVVSLIFVFKWGARRYMIGGAASGHSRAVQVISRTVVSPRQQLMLVKVGRRLVLVANTGTGMNSICEIRDETEVAELLGQIQSDKGESVTKAFGSLFKREEDKFSSSAPDTDPEAEIETDTRESVAVGATRDELSGLMEKVRLVSRQFKRS